MRDGLTGLVGACSHEKPPGTVAGGTRLDGVSDHRALAGRSLRWASTAQRARLERTVGGDLRVRTDRNRALRHDSRRLPDGGGAAAQRGVPSQVIIFTDGRNEADPDRSARPGLRRALAEAADPQRPVALSVVAFGDRPEAQKLADALAPVSGYVDPIRTADEVAAVFVHVAAGDSTPELGFYGLTWDNAADSGTDQVTHDQHATWSSGR